MDVYGEAAIQHESNHEPVEILRVGGKIQRQREERY